MTTRRQLLKVGGAQGAVALVSGFPAIVKAQQTAVKLGVATDLAGPYAAIGGAGSVIATQMAVEDFGGTVLGRPIEVIAADHRNNVDVSTGLAGRWLHDGVNAFVDMTTSSAALAIQNAIKRDPRAVALLSAPGAPALAHDPNCSPVGVYWSSWNTYSVATATAKALMDQGAREWFFLTVDYLIGKSLEGDASSVVKKMGGKVKGSVKHPFGTQDFASFLLQAQASRPQVLALANAGGDTVNAIKQAHEFGLAEQGIRLAALVLYISDVHALGLEVAKNLMLTTSFYWNRNKASREWSLRFFEKHKAMPTVVHASAYSSVTHYLRAVENANTTEPLKVVEAMRKMPISDFFAEQGYLRDDNVMIHDSYLARVKAPEESKEPWDYYEIVSKIPGETIFWPLQEKCAFGAK